MDTDHNKNIIDDDVVLEAEEEQSSGFNKKSSQTEADESEFDDNPEIQIKKIKDKLSVCQRERQEYLDGWQRAKADLLNARKRDEELLREAKERVSESVLMDIIPVIDSFEMAFSNKEAWEKVDQGWRTGVEYIANQLRSVLSERGIVEINPVGDTFDPALHESVGEEKGEDKKLDNTISSVIQKGYVLNNRVLRPAKVKVIVVE
ncbi:MAG: nucleotide exchange factor GrpE [Candidatus Paceibacterota bacterium]